MVSNAARNLPTWTLSIFYLTVLPPASQVNHWSGIQGVTLLMNRWRPLAVFSVCFKAGGSNAKGMEDMSHSNYGATVEIGE